MGLVYIFLLIDPIKKKNPPFMDLISCHKFCSFYGSIMGHETYVVSMVERYLDVRGSYDQWLVKGL